jgi:hypothetical protein
LHYSTGFRLRQVVQGRKLWRTEIVVHAALVFPGRRLTRREQTRLAGGPVASREIVIETMTSKLREAKIGPHHNQLEVFTLLNVIRVAGPTLLERAKPADARNSRAPPPLKNYFDIWLLFAQLIQE